LRTVKMPVFCKVLIAQIAGRAVRAVALCIAVFGFQYNKLPLAILWKSIPAGIFGLCLQWILIPLMIYRIDGICNNK
ncbi:MAG: ECF transporter S component, partial [Clostridia bacterium]|nr:ECF transporter S component [Clostridia bacterium]